jgi:hypothetical protein
MFWTHVREPYCVRNACFALQPCVHAVSIRCVARAARSAPCSFCSSTLQPAQFCCWQHTRQLSFMLVYLCSLIFGGLGLNTCAAADALGLALLQCLALRATLEVTTSTVPQCTYDFLHSVLLFCGMMPACRCTYVYVQRAWRHQQRAAIRSTYVQQVERLYACRELQLHTWSMHTWSSRVRCAGMCDLQHVCMCGGGLLAALVLAHMRAG